jgi:hypothetical protein
LIDGAIDRRAASSPMVSDGLVVATGAVLGEEIEDVVARTRDAVDLVRLPELDNEWVGRWSLRDPRICWWVCRELSRLSCVRGLR